MVHPRQRIVAFIDKSSGFDEFKKSDDFIRRSPKERPSKRVARDDVAERAMNLALHHWQHGDEAALIRLNSSKEDSTSAADRSGSRDENVDDQFSQLVGGKDSKNVNNMTKRVHFKLTVRDTRSNPMHVSRLLLKMLSCNYSDPIAGIVVGTSSLAVEKNLAVLSSHYNIPQVSVPFPRIRDTAYRVTERPKSQQHHLVANDASPTSRTRERESLWRNFDSSLEYKDLYPFLFRMVPPSDGVVAATADYLSTRLQVSYCGILYCADDSGSRILHRAFIKRAAEMNITVVSSSYVQADGTSARRASINLLKETGLRYFVAMMPRTDRLVNAMEDAYQGGIVGPDYFWLFLVGSSARSLLESISPRPLNSNPRTETSEKCAIGEDIQHYWNLFRGAALLHLPEQFPYDTEARLSKNESKEKEAPFSHSKTIAALQNEINAPSGKAEFVNSTVRWNLPEHTVAMLYDSVMALAIARNRVLLEKERNSSSVVAVDGGEIGTGTGENSSSGRNDRISPCGHRLFPPGRHINLEAGEATMRSLRITDFIGVSGRVSMDPSTCNREYSAIPYFVTNIVTPECKGENNASYLSLQPIYVLQGARKWVRMRPQVLFTYWNGSQSPPSTLPPIETASHLLIVDRLFLVVSCATAALSVGLAIWTIAMRNTRIICAAQPCFLVMLCTGVFILSLAAILHAFRVFPEFFYTGPASFVTGPFRCYVTPIFMSMGFAIAVCALLAKMILITSLLQPEGRDTTARSSKVLVPVVLLLCLHAALILPWTVLYPFTLHDSYGEKDEFGRYTNVVEVCTMDTRAAPLLILMLLVHLATLAYTVRAAYKSRKIPAEFSETLHIFMTMKWVVQVIIILLPILVASAEPIGTRIAVRSAFILVVCWAFMFPMFLPKIISTCPKWRLSRSTATSQNSATVAGIRGALPASSSMERRLQLGLDRLVGTDRHRSRGIPPSTTTSAAPVMLTSFQDISDFST